MLHHGIDQAFDAVQAANRGEGRRALLDEELARRARSTSFKPVTKSVWVTCSDDRSRITGRSAGGVGRRGAGEETPQRDHADFLAQRFEIRTDEPVRVFGDFRQMDIGPSGIARVWIFRICRRACVFGTPMSISRSNRPGRRSAGSRTSGMLVRR